jgi:hypothetical protein
VKLIDRHFWFAILLAALILFPRSYLITRSQSERIDDEYHMQRGIAFLNHAIDPDLRLNDPPVGQAIEVLPLWLAHCWPHQGQVQSALWGNRFSANTILMVVGLWKTLLFLPMVGLAFVWARRIYGLQAGWAAAVLMIVEPSIAGHMVVGALDVLGMEGIALACYCAWRYFESPTPGRLILASFTTGFAMVLKHTAAIVPAVVIAFAGLWWIVKPWFDGNLVESWRGKFAGRLGAAIGGGAIVFFTIWALFMFDVSQPILPKLPRVHGKIVHWGKDHPFEAMLAEHSLPAGMYISCFIEASRISADGHPCYLFGERRMTGWWYYFPVVATYKIPIGIFALMAMAIVAIKWNRPTWAEWSLLVPAIAWTALVMHGNFNIGWRHFLPAYVFWMMLATRALVGARGWIIAGWCAIAIAAIHAATYQPDYISYINLPRANAYKDISDSNIDWGQALKQVRTWILKHHNRHVSVREFSRAGPRLVNVANRLADVATIAWDPYNRPTKGIFIISEVPLVGPYEYMDPYKALRKRKPIAIIGHCMRVYDLDKLRKNGKPFNWGPKIPRPPGDEEAVAKKKHKSKPTTKPLGST